MLVAGMRFDEREDVLFELGFGGDVHSIILNRVTCDIIMNPDYYSDIKLAERFMFESSIYLLNMFEKKIDSFISTKTRQSRQRDRNELCHQLHIIDPDGKMEDPIKTLSKDLTKPVWNCITKLQVVAVCVKNSKNDGTPPLVAAMNDVFTRFLQRLKREHQDQSNFRIHLSYVDRAKMVEGVKADLMERNGDWSWHLQQELLEMLEKVREKYVRDLRQRNEQNQFMRVYLQWCHFILEDALVYRQENREFKDIDLQLPSQLEVFCKVVCQNMKSVIESSQGPTCINYWPDLRYLPDIIHPMLIAIYITIKEQLSTDRNADKEEKEKPLSSSLNFSTNQSIDEQSEFVFEELPQKNCSKITFLNLDGYQSPFNIDIVKYLSKYVQYISFPCEDGEALKQQHYYHYFSNYSQFLVKHYVHSELNQVERQFQHKIFKTKERTDKELMEYYKRLFVFPIHSIHLSSKNDINSAEYYQSKFIKFVMKELIYIQIKEFNPSLIVISISNRLSLQTEFLEELIKQLTIIGNMRLLLYNNLTRSYAYETPLPSQMFPSLEVYQCYQQYTRTYDQRIAMFRDNDINLPLFDTTAIFLKISSGTYTLDRTIQEDSVTQKFDIFKVQKYACTLIKQLGKSHPILQKFKNRCNEYLRLERMLSGIYESERANEDTPIAFPFYNRELLAFAKQLVVGMVKGEVTLSKSFLRFPCKEEVERQWEDFSLRYRLAVKRQREEEDYKYITRLKRTQQVEQEEISDDFIALEFQIQRNGVIYLVNIGKQSQICMQPNRQGKSALVYLFNHLLDHRESVLRSYCGEVDPSIERSFEGKVRMRELELPGQLQHCFQHLTKFNYLETYKSVLLFWPTLYDNAQALASRFLHTQYDPTITNLIFLADRNTPFRFTQVIPANFCYSQVLPRCGCTCYQVANTQAVYIFGGFYSTKENYLNFQTDITLVKLGEQIEVTNVPKHFYFDYQRTNPSATDLPFRITRLRHDFVRPRIEYQVYELESGEDLQAIRILLLGGVGERYLRPYSLVGYMAHHLKFHKDGTILQVRRLRLNNLVPANLRRPVRTRVAVQMSTICGAQNRQLYTKRTMVPIGTLAYSWFTCRYVREDQKMTYRRAGQLAVLADGREERPENILTIKENNSQMTAKAVLRHFSSLKQVDNKLALVYQSTSLVQQSYSVIFTLQLELSEEVYLKFVNLPSREVPLTGRHLVAVDTLGLQVYAVVRHQQYTVNRFVLAHCDISGTVQGLVDEHDRRIVLREIYRFDSDMRHCTVKVLPDRRVALLHAFPMHPSVVVPECLLKRTAKGHYVREEVRNDFSNYTLRNFLSESLYRSKPVSFFFVSKQTVVCWSFRSNIRGMGEEEYFFLVEELNWKDEWKRWRLKNLKTVKFQKMFVSNQEAAACVTTILDIRVTGEKKHQIFLTQGGRIYVGNFDAYQADTNTVTFRDYDKTMEEYEFDKFRHKFNVEYLQKLTKYPSRYSDTLQEMEVEGTQ